jgi:hypothetical protein
MDYTALMQAFNVVELLNLILPKGIGELISFATFMGFWLFLGMFTVIIALTKEITYTNARARISMEGVFVIIQDDGGSREIIAPKNVASYTEKLNAGDKIWKILHQGWSVRSNGVRYTILHPSIPHNVSIDELAKFYTGFEGAVTDEQGNVKQMKLRTIIRSARQVDSDIKDMANAAIEELIDPNRKLVNAAIAISLVLGVAFAIVMILMYLPQPAHQVIQEVAQNVTATTTTTLKKISEVT